MESPHPNPTQPRTNRRHRRSRHRPIHSRTRTLLRKPHWVKGLPTSQTIDPGGLAITTTTAYDDQGRVIRTSQPKSSGTDAGTDITTYYSGSGTGTCNGRPEWADAVCQTAPAGAITGGGTNPAARATTTTTYDRWGSPATVTEVANGSTRTTTTTYDNAGRPVTNSITGGVGTAAPVTTTTYDETTGQSVKITSADGSSIQNGYDALGRQRTYTDADGKVTTTAFDTQDRPVSVTDSIPSTTTYSYDTAIDPRGYLTAVNDSLAGTQTARYDADGALVGGNIPGGYTLAVERDPAGATTSRVYTRMSDGLVVLSNTASVNVYSQIITDTGTPGVSPSSTYTYDKAARLSKTRQQNTDGTCTVRGYGFDKNSNRTTLGTATSTSVAVAGEGDNATCPTTLTTTTSTFDTADRLTDGSAYDAFGRATTSPTTASSPASAQTYFVDDLAQSQTSGTDRTTWSRDPGGRLLAATQESNATGTWTTGAVKTNHYDSTSDHPRWISENAANTLITRNVAGIDGTVAASTSAIAGETVLHLSDIHGDVVLQMPLAAGASPAVLDTDEFGNPTPGTKAIKARYTWLGAKQRSSETPTGMTLMGVRLYNPASGRFLSVDPVVGGNPNAYTYPLDPVNQFDVAGTSGAAFWRHPREALTCNRLGARKCAIIIQVTIIASQMASDNAKRYSSNTINAARHFSWQVGISILAGNYAAKKIGNAHEYGLDHRRGTDSWRDLRNNKYSRSWAASHRTALIRYERYHGYFNLMHWLWWKALDLFAAGKFTRI